MARTVVNHSCIFSEIQKVHLYITWLKRFHVELPIREIAFTQVYVQVLVVHLNNCITHIINYIDNMIGAII